jgi:hypothetical protein
MSLICAFTVPCAAIPCSNFPIQGACINKLRHRRLQKFHHPIKEKERQKAVLSGTMVWGWLSTVACSHGFSKSIYLCTCHNLSFRSFMILFSSKCVSWLQVMCIRGCRRWVCEEAASDGCRRKPRKMRSK